MAAKLSETGTAMTNHLAATSAEITHAIASRADEVSTRLRETGESKGYNASFGPRDRSEFLGALDRIVRRALKPAG